jgi:hypothetical protein
MVNMSYQRALSHFAQLSTKVISVPSRDHERRRSRRASPEYRKHGNPLPEATTSASSLRDGTLDWSYLSYRRSRLQELQTVRRWGKSLRLHRRLEDPVTAIAREQLDRIFREMDQVELLEIALQCEDRPNEVFPMRATADGQPKGRVVRTL